MERCSKIQMDENNSCKDYYNQHLETLSLIILISVSVQVDLNKEVEWLNEVKNGHGSVERTSYGQMDSSIKFGVYHIGTAEPRSAAVPRIEICLKEEHGKRRTYSLEQLQELESRLVLIGGSTSNSQNGASEVTEKEERKKVEIEEFLKVWWTVQ